MRIDLFLGMLSVWVILPIALAQSINEPVGREHTMQLTSTAFKERAPIPVKYTCDGVDVSPPLTIHNAPSDAKSLVLIVDDPDAPTGTFDHWIVWNLPPNTKDLAEGTPVPMQGTNHFNEQRYRGPCPPRGSVHRYYFNLFALDTLLDLPAGSSREEVEEAMEGHIVDETELVGIYKRI